MCYFYLYISVTSLGRWGVNIFIHRVKMITLHHERDLKILTAAKWDNVTVRPMTMAGFPKWLRLASVEAKITATKIKVRKSSMANPCPALIPFSLVTPSPAPSNATLKRVKYIYIYIYIYTIFILTNNYETMNVNTRIYIYVGIHI